MNPADPSARRKRKIVLIAALGVFVFILLLIASLPETTQQQPISVPVDRSTETPPPVQVPNFPPLQIQSSGHLPQQVQGVHLGMTIAEAIRVEPDLSTFYPSKKVDPTAAEALLVAKTARGFSNTLEFKGGRLYYMEFELANTSPGDTSLLRSDILAQLGPPSGQVWDFPEITQLVWIDGDVRIAYEDWAFFSLAGESNGRHPRLIVADWPAYQQSLLSSSLDDFSRHHELAKWGEETVQFRPLPRELDGLQLRMLAWQMRSALGSEGLERSTVWEQLRGLEEDLTGWQFAKHHALARSNNPDYRAVRRYQSQVKSEVRRTSWLRNMERPSTLPLWLRLISNGQTDRSSLIALYPRERKKKKILPLTRLGDRAL